MPENGHCGHLTVTDILLNASLTRVILGLLMLACLANELITCNSDQAFCQRATSLLLAFYIILWGYGLQKDV